VFPYDPQILTAVSAPQTSIADVIRTMQSIDALCVDLDGLKWFNRLYLQVTEAVAARCEAGGFGDVAWMVELDVQFAALYFAALGNALSGGRAPGCWRALLDRRAMTAVARIQFALAGVNAHINHDLPVAIGAACRAMRMSPSHAMPQYTDYTAVNSTLESLVDTAKQELMVRLPGDELPAVSNLEQTLAAFSVTAAREAAWNNGEMLWVVRSFPPLQARALSTLDGLTTLAGKTLLVPVPL
jgi:Family of unknown function (DUF5995)